MSRVGPIVESMARAQVNAPLGFGANDESLLLRLNFVQPSYSVTDESVSEPRLRLNFVQDTTRQLFVRPKTGFYFLSESGSDGFYIVRN